MKFSGNICNGPVNKWLNFGGNPDHRMDTGIVFGFVTIGRYGNGINRLHCATLSALTGIAIATTTSNVTSPAHDRQPRQPMMVNDIAILVRRALAEVCTAPVLLHVVIICASTVAWRFWGISLKRLFKRRSDVFFTLRNCCWESLCVRLSVESRCTLWHGVRGFRFRWKKHMTKTENFIRNAEYVVPSSKMSHSTPPVTVYCVCNFVFHSQRLFRYELAASCALFLLHLSSR